MTAKSRGSRAAASLISKSYPYFSILRSMLIKIPSSGAARPRICTECRHTFRTQSRPYAVAAPTLKTLDSSPDITQQKIKDLPPISPHPDAPVYKTFTGVVLSRPPLITPLQTDFEKAFYFYQKRLNERLVLPFTRYFYHKAGTPADADWKTKAKERNWAPAKELGGYNPYSKDAGWHDELLVKDKAITDQSHIRDVLIEDSKPRAAPGQEKEGEVVAKEGEEESGEKSLLVTPLSRRTESDEKNDVRKLDRRLDRTLYLLVKRANGGWGFPSAELVGKENLHQVCCGDGTVFEQD
jgi:large subunit ribosomal protein L46